MKYDGILFDLDGTLWNSGAQVTEAWNEVIAEVQDVLAPYGKGKLLSQDDLKSLFGKPMDEITDILFGDYPDRQALADRCYSHENEYLSEHHGRVYPGIPEAVKALSEKVPLYVVSNCQTGYIEVFLETSGLSEYFSGHLSFGDTGLQKWDNIRLMCERKGLRAPLYIGDTQGDADAAEKAGVPFAHVRYGFGTVDKAELFIDSPEGLVSVL